MFANLRPIEPILTGFFHGRISTLWPNGRVLPVVCGGDGEPDLYTPKQMDAALDRLPSEENPEPDSPLSDEELDKLRRSITATYQNLREQTKERRPTADEVQALRDLDAAAQEVDGEIAKRSEQNEQIQAELAQLDARVTGQAGPEDEEDNEGDEGTEGEQDAAPPADDAPAPEPAEGEPVAIAASARKPVRGRLSGLKAAQPRAHREPPPDPAGPLGRAVITASANLGQQAANLAGQRVTTAEQFGKAFVSKMAQVRGLKSITEGEEYFPVLSVERPNAFRITDVQASNPQAVEEVTRAAVEDFGRRVDENVTKVLRASSADAVLLASGGPCAPAQQEYEVPFLPTNATPFTDGFPSVGFPRGAISFFPPLCHVRRPSRSATGVGTTNGSPTITGTFTSDDRGRSITGTGIPASTTILSVNAAGTQATMSANATATGTIAATIVGRSGNVGRFITAAEDTAGYVSNGGTTPNKGCMRIDCPSPSTCTLGMVQLCLTIGNWVDRTFPEWVRAWRENVAVWFAEAWEEGHMAQYMAGSVMMTSGAAVWGATLDTLSRVVRMREAVISGRRLPASTMFSYSVPAWFVAQLKNDLLVAIGGRDAGAGYANFVVSDAQLISWFRERGINLRTYLDESGTPSGGAAQVLSVPTTGTIPAFPTIARTFLWREGAWVRGAGGELNLGVVRDSTLISTNDFQVFQEQESGLCFRGCAGDSYVMDVTVNPNGAAAGLQIV